MVSDHAIKKVSAIENLGVLRGCAAYLRGCAPCTASTRWAHVPVTEYQLATERIKSGHCVVASPRGHAKQCEGTATFSNQAR